MPALIGHVTNPKNLLYLYRKLHQRWGDVTYVVTYTRSYKDGLGFADRCDGLNEHLWNTEQILYEEYERFDANVILFRLTMYDHLDWWDEYIRYFDRMREHRHYETTLNGGSYATSFYIRTEGERTYSHFLAVQAYRYDLIKRKLDKFKRREKLGNMRHKKQSELSEQEIELRFKKAVQDRFLIFTVGF